MEQSKVFPAAVEMSATVVVYEAVPPWLLLIRAFAVHLVLVQPVTALQSVNVLFLLFIQSLLLVLETFVSQLLGTESCRNEGNQ